MTVCVRSRTSCTTGGWSSEKREPHRDVLLEHALVFDTAKELMVGTAVSATPDFVPSTAMVDCAPADTEQCAS